MTFMNGLRKPLRVGAFGLRFVRHIRTLVWNTDENLVQIETHIASMQAMHCHDRM